jgi:hypothetical protein
MPLLNPAIYVLSSPFLKTTFDVRRRVSVVAGNGRGKTVDTLYPGNIGVIAPAGDNASQRDEGGATGTTTVRVASKFPLRKQADGILPDQVLYRGIEYLVIEVEDALDFGIGWTVATCTSDQIADIPVGRP